MPIFAGKSVLKRYGRAVIFSGEEKIPAAIFPDLKIDLSLVFKE
jgi:hypothetical protein